MLSHRGEKEVDLVEAHVVLSVAPNLTTAPDPLPIESDQSLYFPYNPW